MTSVVTLLLCASIALLIAGGVLIGLRLRRAERALVAVLRLMNVTQPLPRELADYLADTPGGSHRG